MKKLALLALIFILSFALIACGGDAEDTTSELDAEQTDAINAVVDKHNELLDLVTAAGEMAIENGWDTAPNHDEDLGAALMAAAEMLDYTGEQLSNPAAISEDELAEMSQAFDELTPIWQEYLDLVSQPYVAE
jgi:hypothetical protein